MKKSLAGLFVLLFSLIAASSDAKDRLAIGYSAASGVFAGLWIAQDARLFDKYNIDGHLVLIGSGSLMVQSMLGGDLPVSAAAGSASVDAALAGSDMTMFGAIVRVPAFYIMAVPEIKSVAELRGKTVGVTRFGSSTDFALRYLLQKQGFNPDKDVNILQLGGMPELAAALKDPDPAVRREAAKAFWYLAPESAAVQCNLVMALRDLDAGVRSGAADGLKHIGTPAVPDLCAALKDPSADVRRLAADALGGVKPRPREVVPLLFEAAKDQDGAVREAAFDSLGSLGASREDVFQALLAGLGDEYADAN